MYAPVVYVPVTSRRQLYRNRIIGGIGEALITTFCFLIMAFGAGFPWWTGFLPTALFIALCNWLTWKKNLDILYFGSRSLEQVIKEMPENDEKKGIA